MSPPFIHNTMTLHFFLLLLAGHVLSDFLFQTANIAREKERGIKALLMHGIVTYAVHAAVLHCNESDEAQLLADQISEQFSCVSLLIVEAGPIIGTHAGPGTLGVAFHTT